MLIYLWVCGFMRKWNVWWLYTIVQSQRVHRRVRVRPDRIGAISNLGSISVTDLDDRFSSKSQPLQSYFNALLFKKKKILNLTNELAFGVFFGEVFVKLCEVLFLLYLLENRQLTVSLVLQAFVYFFCCRLLQASWV